MDNITKTNPVFHLMKGLSINKCDLLILCVCVFSNMSNILKAKKTFREPQSHPKVVKYRHFEYKYGLTEEACLYLDL